ncbi:MAG: AraC family transcriptional regulator [Clostridia bacterium]
MNEICYVGKHLITHSVLMHNHDDLELIYCTSGNGKFVFNNDYELQYETGDVVMIPPHVTHSNYSTAGFTNIHMKMKNPTFVSNIAKKVTDNSEHHLLSAFSTAFFYYMNNTNSKDLIIQATGELIASYITAFQDNIVLSKATDAIKNDILTNFLNCSYQLDTCIKSLSFNYDYLRKLFQREMGVTPHNYLVSLRMQNATQLLACKYPSEHNISEIAQMSGFFDPLYFSRIFKNKYGCSPMKYAEQHAKNND